jgi:hypothetical protein
LRHSAGFTVKSGEVNIFGQKFEIAEINSMLPGLEIKDNKLWLQGKDISSLPDTIDQLTTANAELTRQYNDLVRKNKDLLGKVTELSGMLDQAVQQRDAAARLLAGQGHDAVPATVATSAITDQRTRILLEAQQFVAAKAITDAFPAAAAPSVTSLTFGIAFSADSDKEQAMTEVRKAASIPDTTIGLYRREKYMRSVAAYPTREAAMSALPRFQAQWPHAYIVDLRGWCPAGATTVPASANAPAEIDCRS